MKHTYEVDYENQEIVVTKAFLRQAGVIGSEAYTKLTQMRADYPDYGIVQREIAKSPRKQKYGVLTYKRMEEHIEAQEGENARSVLECFEQG